MGREKLIDFFNTFYIYIYIYHKSGIKTFLKLSINRYTLIGPLFYSKVGNPIYVQDVDNANPNYTY